MDALQWYHQLDIDIASACRPRTMLAKQAVEDATTKIKTKAGISEDVAKINAAKQILVTET